MNAQVLCCIHDLLSQVDAPLHLLWGLIALADCPPIFGAPGRKSVIILVAKVHAIAMLDVMTSEVGAKDVVEDPCNVVPFWRRVPGCLQHCLRKVDEGAMLQLIPKAAVACHLAGGSRRLPSRRTNVDWWEFLEDGRTILFVKIAVSVDPNSTADAGVQSRLCW